MGCKKSCGKSSCNECNAETGPRGFRGPTGPVGPCCTGATGPGTDIVPTFFPTSKPLAATFYGVEPGVVGPGDIFDFPLDGPNDPIGRLDAGTFLLPFAGLYKIDVQLPLIEPSLAQVEGGAYVQAVITAQTIEEGAFVPVVGGVFGRGAALSQLVGETIVEATRNNFPIRVQNTSNIPVNYYVGNPAMGNQRTINIASLVPQKTYAAGFLLNTVPQVVAPGADVTFNQSGQTDNAIGPSLQSNVGVVPPTPPFVGLVIEQPGIYVIEWGTRLIGDFQQSPFVVYVNGMPIGYSGSFGGPPDYAFRVRTHFALQVGDVVTLRNESGAAIPLENPSPGAPINASLHIYRAFPQ